MCLAQKGVVLEVKGKKAVVEVNGEKKELRINQKLRVGEEVNVFQGLAFK